jgi:prevent-host-death family protein
MHRTARKPKPSKPKRKTVRLGTRWQLQEAKANLSRMVKEAQKEPQIITLHGHDVAVVQSMNDYQKTQHKNSSKGPNLLEVLLQCPPGPPLIIDRDPDDVVGDLRPNIFD